MSSQRILQQSCRFSATSRPACFSRTALSKFASPTAVAIRSQYTQKRPAATQTLKHDEGNEILIKQRLNRPISPHLSIYQPQVTWYLSALNRITGSILSGGLYVFAAAYLVAPLAGWHLESATMAAAFASWPVIAKFATKYLVSLPFTFHSFNGIRHLIWDTGSEFSNKQIQRTGWFVVGLTFVSSGVLAYI